MSPRPGATAPPPIMTVPTVVVTSSAGSASGTSDDHVRHSRKQTTRRCQSLFRIEDTGVDKVIPLKVTLNNSHHHRHHSQVVAFIDLVAPVDEGGVSNTSHVSTPPSGPATPTFTSVPTISLTSITTSTSTSSPTLSCTIPSTAPPLMINPSDSDDTSGGEVYVAVTCPCCNAQFNLSEANLALKKAAGKVTVSSKPSLTVEHRPRASSATAFDRPPKVGIPEEREEDMPRFTEPRFQKVEEPYSENNSIFSEATEEGGAPPIKAATIYKLVHYFTSDIQPRRLSGDDDDMGAFLLTYRIFSASSEFLELLHARFFAPRPEGTDWEIYRKTKLNQIRLRISNLMKYWFMLCPEDFKYDPALQEQCRQALLEFVDRFPPCRVLIGNLQTVIETRPQIIPNVGVQRTAPPTPILYEDIPHITSFFDLHPEEVARQMALIEYESFMKIRSSEFVYKMANKNRENFKNITEMTAKINRHVNWVSTEILAQKDIVARAFVLHKFILVAMASLGINNLSTVKEIMSSLGSSAIHRLRSTWRILPSNTMEIFCQLERFISSNENHQEYRARLQTIFEKHPKHPCVPFLGISITDCLFLNQGNPDTIESPSGEKMINFAKWRRLAKVIRELAKFQGTTYNLIPVYSIQHFLETVHVEESEDALFEMSKALEDGSPNPKDEKFIQKLAKKIFKEDKRKIQKHPHIEPKPQESADGKTKPPSSS
ncbi:Ras guanine-nucleotide exchange protein [Pelomyxa schiedti]|nr:Ras guanine-nucleotide exchange protein [Pelomyxa schiedti]